MPTDARGLALTTASDAAAGFYNDAIAELFEYRLSAGKTLGRALEEDPDFFMGLCTRGYFFLLMGTNAVAPRVAQTITSAEALVGGVSPREAAHLGALKAWARGDLSGAVAAWGGILVEQPHDLLALRLQHGQIFWLGQSANLRDCVARVSHAWSEDIPGYAQVLGMYSFGLEECGEYDQAEALGRRAVELHPDDLWAVHAVAHVLEMQGRLKDGIAWLDYPDDAFDDRTPFRGHLWWHRAMYSLEAGDYDAVLGLYDRVVQPDPSDFYLDVQNTASMLARLEFQGVDVGGRWTDLADIAERQTGDHTLAFTEMHYMLALAATGCDAAAATLLDSLRAFAETPGNDAAAATGPVVLPVCEAILAHARGEHGKAVELLLPLRYDLARTGGSHAQRDVFAQVLIAAAIADGRVTLARALLSERLNERPNSHGSWLKYAGVLEQLGDAGGAENARQRAARVAA